MRAIPLDGPRIRTPKEIFAHLDRYVIGQERAKRTLAIAAYNHLKRIGLKRAGAAPDGGAPPAADTASRLLRKSNVLLIGPTGCGKTHLARHLAAVLDLPLAIVDATEYTEAGYYGKDVEVMVAELLFRTGGDVDRTQQGVIFIDEIDKIARRAGHARTGAGSRDIGGEGVRQALLKLLDGEEIFVPLNVTQHWNKHDFVLVDTSEILFLCAGTFSDMPRLETAPRLGFGRGGAPVATDRGRRVTVRDLEAYGMIPELLGRLPVVVQLAALTEADLVRVLREPPDSILREYEARFAADEIRLVMTPDALHEIARLAIGRGLGARGLRAMFEEIAHDEMFDAPALRGSEVRIDADLVRARLADFV